MARKSYYDFQERTGKLESNGNYSAKNDGGYKGKYQFGVGALMDAGYYKGNKNGDLKNRWDGEWTGKDGVHSLQDFMSNPKAQDNAFKAYNKRQWDFLMITDKLGKYVGKEVNGIVMTPARMLAGAHLVGHVGMATYIKSNGKEIPVDGNKVPVDYRMKQFNDDYDVSEITGIPHRDYIEENHSKKRKSYNSKYTPEKLSKMSKLEYFLKEKEINEDIERVRKNTLKEYYKRKTGSSPMSYVAPSSHTSDLMAYNQNNSYSPSKHINFNGISKNGIPWKNWSEGEQRGFLEGFIGKPLDKVDKNKNKKGHWTDKFNIGNPDTDDGHWVTLDNGKHLFIKDT